MLDCYIWHECVSYADVKMTHVTLLHEFEGQSGKLGHCDLHEQKFKKSHIFCSYQQKPCIHY